MARYSQSKIRQLLKASNDAVNVDIKGAKLEELTRYLFSKIPHISFHLANVLDGRRAHELDVIFTNDVRHSDLYFLDFLLITECKNTDHRVSSAQVGWFVRKLQDRPVKSGILIALSGITGVADGEGSAHSEILNALIRDNISIFVITREDILGFSTTDDLITLIKAQYLHMSIQRTIR